MFMKYFKNLFSLGLNFLSQYDKESLSSMEQISDNDNYLIWGFFQVYFMLLRVYKGTMLNWKPSQ